MTVRLPVLVLCLLAAVVPGRAQEAPAGERAVVVGVWDAPPFAIPGEGGDWDGLGVHLWRTAARELGLDVTFRAVPEDSAAALRYTADDVARGLRIRETGVRPRRYAFALPPGSPLREPLDRVLLQEMSEPGWPAARDRFLPEKRSGRR